MKTAQKQRVGVGQTLKVPQKRKASPPCIGVNKSTKFSGKTKNSAEKNTGVLPCTPAQPLDQHIAKQACFLQSTAEVPETEPITDQLHPSTKIKLQLFPINEDTRIKLENDGYNPFLELTLRARKKISSVIKHIDSKWGSSTITTGEIILVPYSTTLDKVASGKRWTLNDTSITAGDVYAAMDRPAVFHLRYGWFSNLESNIPFQSTCLVACLRSEGFPKNFVATSEVTPDSMKKLESTSEDIEIPNHVGNAADKIVTEQCMDVSANRLDGEEKRDNGIGQSIVPLDNNLTSGTGQFIPWDDSILNLSIGGFISELSLLGKADGCSMKSTQSQQGLHQIELISDISIGGLLNEASLQGKTSNHKSLSNSSKSALQEDVGKGLPFPWDDSLTNLSIGGLLSEASLQEKIHLQPAKPSLRESHSSILDAEETCHAFSYQKSSSIKGELTLNGSTRPGSCSDYAITNSTKDSCPEFKEQIGLIQDPSCQESKTDHQPGSRLHSEDSCTGLTGIKWNDSLGPFDIGLSSLRPVFGGDSVSFGKLIQ